MNYISVVKENFLNTPIDYLKGVGPNRSEILKKEFSIRVSMSDFKRCVVPIGVSIAL